eukprot:2309108-Amphidinium_carterae.1
MGIDSCWQLVKSRVLVRSFAVSLVKDVFFMKSELPPAGVPDGQELQFYVRMNEKGPQATRIQLPGRCC